MVFQHLHRADQRRHRERRIMVEMQRRRLSRFECFTRQPVRNLLHRLPAAIDGFRRVAGQDRCFAKARATIRINNLGDHRIEIRDRPEGQFVGYGQGDGEPLKSNCRDPSGHAFTLPCTGCHHRYPSLTSRA